MVLEGWVGVRAAEGVQSPVLQITQARRKAFVEYGEHAENMVVGAAGVDEAQDRQAELFLSGPGIVGLAFTPSRAMIVATTSSISW